MSFLLDTNVISEAMKREPSARVLNWLAARGEETLFLSAITLGELRRGALLLSDAKRRKALLNWIERGVKADFAGRIIPVDAVVMESWADIQASLSKQGKVLPTMDGLIAATASTHGLTVVTRNERDYKLAGVRVLNPW